MPDVITERLRLRAMTADDVDELVDLDSDPEVVRYITGGRASTRAEVTDVVSQSLGSRWMAYERVSATFVGWFELRPSDDQGRERELGYRLRRTAWGQGYATEGSRALVALAFEQLGVERVWAQTMTVNLGSQRVMERCGLRYVRTFHLDWDEPIEGTDEGDVEYELLRRDWPEQR